MLHLKFMSNTLVIGSEKAGVYLQVENRFIINYTELYSKKHLKKLYVNKIHVKTLKEGGMVHGVGNYATFITPGHFYYIEVF